MSDIYYNVSGGSPEATDDIKLIVACKNLVNIFEGLTPDQKVKAIKYVLQAMEGENKEGK